MNRKMHGTKESLSADIPANESIDEIAMPNKNSRASNRPLKIGNIIRVKFIDIALLNGKRRNAQTDN